MPYILQVDGKTPLHYAAERGVQATVKVLLDKGASAVIPDWQGRLPHHLASGKIQSLLLKEAEKQGGSSFKHRYSAVLRCAVSFVYCVVWTEKQGGSSFKHKCCAVMWYAVLRCAVLGCCPFVLCCAVRNKRKQLFSTKLLCCDEARLVWLAA